MSGVLSGLKIIEIQGIGPAPFSGMHLADMGADVVVVERPGAPHLGDLGEKTITKRGKRVVKLNLKDPEHISELKKLIALADGLIEGMRPGVMERLGLGPDVCLKINPKLVYGRVTGWGQDGPLSKAAGHDINYSALTGALWYSGRPGQPPLATPTMLGDIGGGALYLTIGMLAGILKARETGKGDVIDAAMIDGSAHMMNLLLAVKPLGVLVDERGKSMLDGPHWYDTYECQCGGFVSIGSLEPQFYALLLESLGLSDDPVFKSQMNPADWPEQKARLTEIMKSKTRDEWCDQMEGTDICFAPVLTPTEAAEHKHMQARGIYTSEPTLQARPAPRFASTEGTVQMSDAVDITLEELSKDWG